MATILIEMKMRLSNIGVETRNIFYASGPLLGPEQATGTIAALRTAYSQHLAPRLSSHWTLYGASYRDVSIAGMGGVDVSIAPVVGGIAAAELLPPTVAALVSFKTGTTAPKQGRKYLSGFPEVAQANGRWMPFDLTAMQAWGDAVVNIGSAGGSDHPLGVARVDPQTGVATAWNPYALAIAREICATMRSRRIGQGI